MFRELIPRSEKSILHFHVSRGLIRSHYDQKYVFNCGTFSSGNKIDLWTLKKIRKEDGNLFTVKNQLFDFGNQRLGTYEEVFHTKMDAMDDHINHDHTCAFLYVFYFSTRQMLARAARAFKELRNCNC